MRVLLPPQPGNGDFGICSPCRVPIELLRLHQAAFGVKPLGWRKVNGNRLHGQLVNSPCFLTNYRKGTISLTRGDKAAPL